MLGTVTAGGVFTMDRPLTVIEAIARAGGLETGMHERGTVELADLTRSFLARKQQRVPVDFERLFQRGDLTQNVALGALTTTSTSGAAGANEIYVLGQVGNPGVLTFAPKATLISAIASRGGFSGKAFKSRGAARVDASGRPSSRGGHGGHSIGQVAGFQIAAERHRVCQCQSVDEGGRSARQRRPGIYPGVYRNSDDPEHRPDYHHSAHQIA